jgi:hypothetical protein
MQRWFVKGYNAQAAAEPRLQLIVGQSVMLAANDKAQLERCREHEKQHRWTPQRARRDLLLQSARTPEFPDFFGKLSETAG